MAMLLGAVLDLNGLIVAFAGGVYGAAVGATYAFIGCGVLTLVGVGVAVTGHGQGFLDGVPNGPFFGLHVSFAGGVAAAAYAARRGLVRDGQDLDAHLVGLGTAGPLVVGGLFGVTGQAIVVGAGPWLNTWTNAVACTVFSLNVVARLVFGRSGLFGPMPLRAGFRRRFVPVRPVDYRHLVSCTALIGFVGGGLSSGTTLLLARAHPEIGTTAMAVGFGVSAVSMAFIAAGKKIPITHHITLTSATAAYLSGSVLVGAVVGSLAGIVGELVDRAFQTDADSQIDPPAGTIWSVTAVIYAIHLLV
jgi:hypothetical protein